MAFTGEQQDRYNAAAHSIQSATAYDMDKKWRGSARDAKHLRVGIDLRAVEHGALVFLLIEKGVITETEYADALCTAMEQEAESTAARVRLDHELPPGCHFK